MEVIKQSSMSVPNIMEFQRLQESNRIFPNKINRKWISSQIKSNLKRVEEPHPYFDLKMNTENCSELSIAAWYFIGSSTVSQTIREHMVKAVRLSKPIMIIGEAGTGKRYAAQLIHRMSTSLRLTHQGHTEPSYATKPWIELNPFINEKNESFSISNFRPLLHLQDTEAATIFLNLSQGFTIARLRTIHLWMEYQEQQEMTNPVIGPIQWIINMDPFSEISLKQRHPSLWSRLATLRIQLSTLDARREDLHQLVHQGLALFAKRLSKSVPIMTPELQHWISAHPFPGNFAELRLVLERIVLEERQEFNNINALADVEPITAENSSTQENDQKIPSDTLADSSSILHSEKKAKKLGPELILKKTFPLKKGKKFLMLKQHVQNFEREIVKALLYECHGNQSQCAKYLGISRRTLYKKINSIEEE